MISPTLLGVAGLRPDVSVVVPARNHGRYLGPALNSVFIQTGCSFEIIVVDDGSTDGTQEVLRRYGSQVRSVRTASQGAAAARNTGCAIARGDLIAFLDADDSWLPGKLSAQIRALRESPDAGLVYCDTLRVRPDGGGIDRWSTHFPPVSGHALVPQIRRNRIQTSTVMIRRSVLGRVGGFDPALAAWEDIDLWVRIAAHYRLAYVDKVLATYRMGQGLSSASRAMATGRLASVRKVLGDSAVRLPRAQARKALADAFLAMATAEYLETDLGQTRKWLMRAWARDVTTVARLESARMLTVSLLGRRLVDQLRRTLRAPSTVEAS